MTLTSDLELLDQWTLKRDANAFRDIVSRHGPMVYGTCRRVLGDAVEAEDVTQECFEVLARTSEDPRQHLGGWLHRVATHRSLNRVKEKHQRRKRETKYAASQQSSAQHQWDDIYGFVDEAIAVLPEEVRTPLIAHYLQGESHKSIAKATGVPRRTVSYRISRGVTLVGNLLRERGIIIQTAVLSTLLSANMTSATSLPASLVASLGKLGLLYSAKSAVTATLSHAGPAGMLGGLLTIKNGAIFVVAGALISAPWVLWQLRNGDSGAVPPVAANASSNLIPVAPEAEPIVVSDADPGSNSNEAESNPIVETIETTPGEIPSATETTVTPADQESDGFRVVHFPQNSGLGSLSVLSHRGTQTYRLGREPGDLDKFDQWESLAVARGEVSVPVGKPLKLTIRNEGLPYLDQLSSLAPDDLHTISFQLADSPTIYGEQILPYVQHLTGLKVLELYGVEATGEGLWFIKDLRNLERLELSSSSYFENASLSNLEQMTSLEVLNLYVPVGAKGLQYLSALPSLRELSLKYRNIRGPGLAYLADIPTLEFLQIRGDGFGNQTGGPTNSALQYLESVTSLKSLLLYHTKNITDAGVIHLAKLTNLDELSFVAGWGGEGFRITNAGMPTLGSMTQLRSLNLGSTLVTDKGLAHLIGLDYLENLTLPLGITDQGLQYVSELGRLKRLNARGVTPAALTEQGAFTDAGLRHLSRLSRLEELSINSGSGITDAGLAHLARLRNLKHLAIMCNGITDDGMTHIARLKNLNHLAVSCPNSRAITVSGLNHLNTLTGLHFLKASSIVQDESTLNLSNLTELENLMISIKESSARRAPHALRDADLAWLAGHRRLMWVQVGAGDTFSDEGMAHLKGLTRIQRLGVGGNWVTDEGLSYVAGMTTLDHLTVTGNFSDQGLRRLDGLIGLTYLNVNSGQGLSAAAREHLQLNLPNLYWLNGQQVLAGR